MRMSWRAVCILAVVTFCRAPASSRPPAGTRSCWSLPVQLLSGDAEPFLPLSVSWVRFCRLHSSQGLPRLWESYTVPRLKKQCHAKYWQEVCQWQRSQDSAHLFWQFHIYVLCGWQMSLILSITYITLRKYCLSYKPVRFVLKMTANFFNIWAKY
jgi:hypothetical protein